MTTIGGGKDGGAGKPSKLVIVIRHGQSEYNARDKEKIDHSVGSTTDISFHKSIIYFILFYLFTFLQLRISDHHYFFILFFYLFFYMFIL